MVAGELMRHHPHGLLADAGCGPGYLLADIVRAIPRLSVIGVDIAEQMLQKAAQNLSSAGLAEKVGFRVGNVEELPFDNSSLDFVVSTLSLHHWAEPKQAIEEIYRVLKPGGQFLVFDLRRDSPRLFYWLLRFAQTFILPSPMKRTNEPTLSVLASYTPSELGAFLADTSFGEWRIKPGLFWIFIWGHKDDLR